jgi:hypothetical protein
VPALPPVDSPSSLRIEWVTADDASINAGSRIFMSYTGSAPSAADLNSLATAVSTAWSDNIKSSVGGSEALVGVTVTDLATHAGAQGSWSGSIGGTATGELPASAAVLVNHQIVRRYRGGRPRTYVRAGTTANLTGTNKWSSGFISGFLTSWQAFVAQILATTGIGISLANIVNVSYYEGFTAFELPSGRYRNISTPRTTPVVDTIIDSSVATKIASQRRRLNL